MRNRVLLARRKFREGSEISFRDEKRIVPEAFDPRGSFGYPAERSAERGMLAPFGIYKRDGAGEVRRPVLNPFEILQVDVSLIASTVADRDPVRFNGSQWVTDNSPAAFGVWDADTNTVIIEGYLEGFTGLTPGEYVNEIAYAISTTAVIVNGGGAYPTYTVFITQPQNGNISLDTPYTGPGGSITATIQPLSEAYIVGDVLVDGVSVGPVEQYIFSDMQENHRITAVMIEPPVYTVRLYKNKSATSGAGVLEVYSSNPADDLSTQDSRLAIVQQYARHCLVPQNLSSVKYVNESNYAQDVNGNTVDLTGADGDFMLEIDRLYWDCVDNSSYWDIQFSRRKPSTLAVTAHTFNGE